MGRNSPENETQSGAGRSALLLTNWQSGGDPRRLDAAIERLEQAEISVRRVAPDSIENLRRHIRDSGETMVVLAGGDGTMNAAAPALLDLERPVGLLPLGTANDLARTLGIPFDPAEAAEVIIAGRTRRIDLGQIDGRPFFNVASIGLSAEVAREHEGAGKDRLGVLNYPASAWRAFRRHRPFRAEIVVDGAAFVSHCMQVAVGNGRHYGGGLTIDATAEIDDGWLRVYYLKPAGLLSMLWVLPALRFGWLGRAPEAEVKWARRVEIRTPRPQRVNVDGELDGLTPVSIDVLPGALAVYAPGREAAAAL